MTIKSIIVINYTNILLPDPTYYNVVTDISENVKGGVIPESEKITEISFSPPPTRYCVSFDRYINETNGIELS